MQNKNGFRKLSRTKIELFLNCPRCFYLDVKLRVKRPGFPAFTLNNAVDELFKKEFDIHRAKGEAHPLMKQYEINAVPFSHPDLNKWRHNFTGVQYFHEPTNTLYFGAVDDIWLNHDGKLHVVDYKATSTNNEISLDDKWKQAYKRQMEIYQWLLRHNGFDVSDTGYFVFANGDKDRRAFDGKLEFKVTVISYTGDGSWIEGVVADIDKLLKGDKIPKASGECEYCAYAGARSDQEKEV